MSKKLLAVLLAALMLVSTLPAPALAAANTGNSGKCGANLTWTLDDAGTLTISGTGAMYDYPSYSNWSTSREIVNIVIESGVTSIGNWAFSNLYSLKTVSIPSSVTSIGNKAFSSTYKLESVTMANGLKTIGDGAFYGWNCLTEINIPNSVTSIGESAFAGCSKLTSITLPTSLESIGAQAFVSCSALTGTITIPKTVSFIGYGAFSGTQVEKFVVQSGNTHFKVYKQALYSIDGKILLAYPRGVSSGYGWTISSHIYLPAGLEKIEDWAFFSCTNVVEAHFPAGLKEIGDNAFRDGALFVLDLPGSLTTIGERAFYSCDYLGYTDSRNSDKKLQNNTIVIPSTVTSVGTEAFSCCYDLYKFRFNASVRAVPDKMLSSCTKLRELTLGEGIQTIGSAVCKSCSALKTVTLPSTISSIKSDAFSGCTALSDVYYNNTAEEWDRITVASNNDPLLNATIHKLVHHPAAPATCEEAGSIEYWSCTACDDLLSAPDHFSDKLSSDDLIAPALGHAWGEPVWTWEGFTAASATFTCANDPVHTVTLEAAAITEKITVLAGAEPGLRTYTASVVLDGETYTDTAEEVLPAAPCAFSADVVGSDAEGSLTYGLSVSAAFASAPEQDGGTPMTMRVVNADGLPVSAGFACLLEYDTPEGTVSVSCPGGGFTLPAEATALRVQCALIGDANLDGKLAVADITAQRLHILDKKALSGLALLAADTNGDGKIAVADITVLRLHILGKKLLVKPGDLTGETV